MGDGIRKARGRTSQEDLAIAVRQKTGRKLTAGTISQIETGRIRPELDTIEAIALTLDADAWKWDDYRLAKMRASLDERVVGLDQAIANADTIEDALSEPALADLGRGSAPAAPADPQSSKSERANG